jgi:hypothetical protein
VDGPPFPPPHPGYAASVALFDKIFRRRRGRESDQLPEEGPAEQMVDDLPQDARPEATSSPGGAGPGKERQTGHPDEADERDQSD